MLLVTAGWEHERDQSQRDDLRRGPDRILAERVFKEDSVQTDLSTVSNLADVESFGNHIANQPDVLVAAWYTNSYGVITNYFVYILDLKPQVLIVLSLTT